MWLRSCVVMWIQVSSWFQSTICVHRAPAHAQVCFVPERTGGCTASVIRWITNLLLPESRNELSCM